jgi:hypothetical protein
VGESDSIAVREFMLFTVTCQLVGNRKSAEMSQKGRKFFVDLLMHVCATFVAVPDGKARTEWKSP